MTGLISWSLRNRAVAAISAAGLVAAGFLIVTFISNLREDPAASDLASVASHDIARPDFMGGSAIDTNPAPTQRSGPRDVSRAVGSTGGSGLSQSRETAGEVDVYIADSEYGRSGVFEIFGEAGGIPWEGGEPNSHDENDEAVRDDADMLLGDDRDEEPYARNAVIAGRVMNDSGIALVGIGMTATAIHLFDVPPGVTVPVGDLQRHAVSDTAGRYRFDNLVPGEYRVNNMPTETYGMTQISVRSGVNVADIVLITQRTFNVVGQVTDTMGQPLAGALVQPQILGERGAYTDSTGSFELQLQVGEQASGLGLRTELYGYRGKMTLLGAGQVSGEQYAAVNIQLEALEKHTVVTGILRSAEDGSPVARKTVQLYSAERQQRYHGTSKTDGRFVMTAVEADTTYELLVAGGGGYATYLQPSVAVSENGLDLELLLVADENRTLTGRMVNLHGMPIANFSLIARAAKPPFQSMRVTSDAAGNFVLRNPPPGPLVFESQSIPHLHVSGVQVPAMAEQAVTLTLDIGRDEIYGFVVDTNGEPVTVPNVVVSWRHTQNGITSSSTRRAAADTQGGFSFRQLGPGVHTIHVNAAGYKPARVDHDAAIEGYEFTVRLEADTSG